MQRSPYQSLSALLLLTLPCIAWAAGPIGGYYTEDRALTSPVPDPNGTSQYAISVSISDGVALVEAAQESVSGNAYLYDSKTGALLHALSPGNNSVSNFGRTVATDGKYAVVSSDQGSYVYDVNNYQLLHVLPRSHGLDVENGLALIGGSGVYDLASGQHLAQIGAGGTSAALSGDYAVIGYVGIDNHDPGWAVVFDWKAG